MAFATDSRTTDQIHINTGNKFLQSKRTRSKPKYNREENGEKTSVMLRYNELTSELRERCFHTEEGARNRLDKKKCYTCLC